MTRQFIGKLTEREKIDEVYLASEKQLRTNRAGNYYVQVRLADRTGSLTAMIWNANDDIYKSFENGNFIRVQGATQFYNGSLQLIATRIERVDAASIDEADFVTLAVADVERFGARLREMLRGLTSPPLASLAECFLMDETFMDKLSRAPAGVKNHHAYQGGLLEHVVGVMELAMSVGPRYADVDTDQLVFGAFLHDLGKVEELTYERDLGYSDEGQLIGHVVIACRMLDEKIAEVEKLAGEPFPSELRLRLLHMVVSHHGQYEFGSPKLPMTLEAMALYYIDNLDAKLHALARLIRDDSAGDSRWTPYEPSLSRKLFKGEVPENVA